tara:strand:- start:756 stop:1715 length:960 start_codon:yes stop_codon:yes gene_type:complete
MKKKMDIITGGAGLIGSTLIETIIKKKKIICIDDLSGTDDRYIKKFYNKKNFVFIKQDLSKKISSNNKLIKLLKKYEIKNLWLLAANSDIQKGIKNKNVDFKKTYLTTVKTIDFFQKRIKKKTNIIFTSSSAVYGDKKILLKENDKNFYPISNYGKMKLKSEIFLKNLSYNKECKVLIVRLPNVIGGNLTHGVIFDLIKKAFKNNFKKINILGDGYQKKPYAIAEEVTKGLIFFNTKIKERFTLINFGLSDNGITVRYIANQIKKKFNVKKLIYQKKKFGWIGDVPKYKMSNKKINSYGFKFRFNSKKAVDFTIKNFRF